MGGGAEGVPRVGAVPVAEWIVLFSCNSHNLSERHHTTMPLDAPERTVSGGEFGDEVREDQDDDVKGARESVDSVNIEGSEFS